MSDLTDLDISALAPLIARREVSPVEATEAYLARIDRYRDLDAYIAVYPERALAAARRAEAEIAAGELRGPLHGVPVAVKDLFRVAGMARTCGSRFFREAPAAESATSVARLEAAGAVILGHLNLHEFAYGPTGVNPHHGTARNPWNRDLVCGGSSSGSGCATAARLAAATLGTDTGGSIRIPASLCGVVGLKQTYGLASRHGIFPLSERFDHGGPLTRSVADAALMLQAIAGADDNDPSTAGAKLADTSAGLGQGIEGTRIAVPKTLFFDALHPDVMAALGQAATVLADLGALIEEVELPFDAQAANSAWNVLALADAYRVHAAHLRDHGDDFSPDVHERLLKGGEMTDARIAEAEAVRDHTRAAMTGLMAEADALFAPTAPIPAVPIDGCTIAVMGKTIDGVKVLGRLTRLAPFTGQPAISLPCGFTEDGLPIGLQLIGRRFEDAALLRLAHAYEQATVWRRRRPPLDEGAAP